MNYVAKIRYLFCGNACPVYLNWVPVIYPHPNKCDLECIHSTLILARWRSRSVRADYNAIFFLLVVVIAVFKFFPSFVCSAVSFSSRRPCSPSFWILQYFGWQVVFGPAGIDFSFDGTFGKNWAQLRQAGAPTSYGVFLSFVLPHSSSSHVWASGFSFHFVWRVAFFRIFVVASR